MILALSGFLEIVSPIPLHHRKNHGSLNPWVFWSQYEGSHNNSSSTDVGTPVIHEKITSSLSNILLRSGFAQFWTPVRNSDRWVLTTSGQPFAVSFLSNEHAMYRVYSEKYKYNIDVNQLNNEGDHMIISGGPASAFINRFPCMDQLQWISSEECCFQFKLSIMLPICFPSQSSSCIGVLEFTVDHSENKLGIFLLHTVTALKKVGLDVFYVQDLIPYMTVNGGKLAKDEIQEALKVACESHNLALAQVWIAYENKKNVPFSYSLEDTQTKRLLAIKLTGYLYAVAEKDFYDFILYFRLGNVTPRAIEEELTPVTLQDYESRYISKLRYDMLVDWRSGYFNATYSALAICLRSNDTGDFNYAFEFIWTKNANHVKLLEALLLTLKKCLPKFKFASGVELGKELDVHNKDDETKFKIFQGKRSTVVDHIAPSKVTCKTTPKVLPQEVTEKQFEKTMKVAEGFSGSSELSEFLENFSPIPLNHREPGPDCSRWVFWSQNDGSQNNSSTADVGTLGTHEKIISALSDIEHWGFLAQFWAPATTGGRKLLSTSGQPFAVSHLSNELAKCRIYSEKYQYNIDENQLDNEGDHMVITGGPASAFLNRLPYMDKKWIPSEDCDDVYLSFMLPICFPTQISCIGVLHFIVNHKKCALGVLFSDTVTALKKVGLDVFPIQDVIPYKKFDVSISNQTVNDLTISKDDIQEALKVVCESHNLALAQVWIAYEDIQTKRLLPIKLTGYLYAVANEECDDFERYFRLGDVASHAIEGELALETLQDYESRYLSELRSDMLINWEDDFSAASALTICLMSNDTGDFRYVFEFIWTKHSNYVILLEALLLTLKRCLPKFKFTSGVELGNELDIHNKDNETKFKIFQGKQSMVVDYIAPSEVTCKTTPKAVPRKVIEKQFGKTMKDVAKNLNGNDNLGKRSMVVDYIAPSEVTCKTAPKVVPREVIEKQFGKTMKDAAKNLNVSLSTLKRKIKELGILEWPGPNFVKRNKNDSSIIQINTNEEDNGAIEYTSTVNLNKNILTIKAEYVDDMIKFHLPLSQATFVTVEKEIGKRLKLSDRSYKLKYLDEDEDWISLTSDEEMHDCIRSSRKSDRIIVRMREENQIEL